MQSAEAWGDCNGTAGSGADTTGPSIEEGTEKVPQATPEGLRTTLPAFGME